MYQKLDIPIDKKALKASQALILGHKAYNATQIHENIAWLNFIYPGKNRKKWINMLWSVEIIGIEQLCKNVMDKFAYEPMNKANFLGKKEQSIGLALSDIFQKGGFVDKCLPDFVQGKFDRHKIQLCT